MVHRRHWFPRQMALLLGALLGFLTSPAAAHAGGFSNPDFGIRRIGMFAVVGYPDDVTAIFHNPAGLILNSGTYLYHAESWFHSGLAFRMYDSKGQLKPDHDIRPDWSYGAIPFLGMVSDFTTERFRAGIAVYAPNAYGAVLPVDEPTRYHATRALFLASRLTLAAAYALSDRFSMGANFNVIHVYLAATRFVNPFMLDDWDRRFDAREETRYDDYKLVVDGQDWTWSADVGLLFQPTDSFRIGAVFAGGSDINLEGDVILHNPPPRPEEGQVDAGEPLRATHKTGMVIPFTLRAGFNWEFVKDFQLGADVRMWHYQVLQEQRTVLSQKILGEDEWRDPKNYANSFNWCVGLLHRVAPDWEVMMGYQQDFTPIPEETFSLDNPSRDQQGISLGLRWQATENLRLGLAFVRNWFEIVDIQKSISEPPANAKGYGANTELGFDISWKL